MIERLSLRAHAKINLSLRVLGCRPDGYHDLKTLFQSIALHDTLVLERQRGVFALECRTPGVPLDERNLVWRAARLVWRESGRSGEPQGWRARLIKRIPAQGGLGGGSADAAAALVAFDAAWRVGIPPRRLTELGLQLGADVPFFLCGGTALGLNRGDEIYPLVDAPTQWVLLVFPPFGVSTPEAFGWWDEDHAAGLTPAEDEAALQVHPVSCLLSGAGWQLQNDLEAPVARRHPAIDRIHRALEAAGADAATMTGSGSTLVGLFSSEQVVRRAARRAETLGGQLLITRFATRRQASHRLVIGG